MCDGADGGGSAGAGPGRLRVVPPRTARRRVVADPVRVAASSRTPTATATSAPTSPPACGITCWPPATTRFAAADVADGARGNRLRPRTCNWPAVKSAGRSSPSGLLPEALLTGSASIYQSIRCALALANHLDEPQPEWEVAVGRLGHAIVAHPEAFTEKPHHSMEWYYPILGGALRGPAADARIDERWARLRGQRAGHPLRRRSAVGHRRRDMRTGADARGDGRPRPCARAVRQHATSA